MVVLDPQTLVEHPKILGLIFACRMVLSFGLWVTHAAAVAIVLAVYPDHLWSQHLLVLQQQHSTLSTQQQSYEHLG